ncbi:hypothetical protein [Bradyrhizobium sp. KB893862 SZCCT0404]|uniref:hypothetical protein n=1 Tax=Bradyrhizobium sp. KB893862 SZCCT0404 TaxID=2807672 RepID=UPI00201327BD|nr:hypothetical protein [Bradyrhizobium sp. KB893862 SZCCT0404]
MTANDNLLAIAQRIPDPCAVSQERVRMQSAGRPPDQALDDIVPIEAVDGMRATAHKRGKAGHQRTLSRRRIERVRILK